MEFYILGKYRALIVKITGELDDHSAANVREIIDRELQKTGAVNIVFDFSRLGFMDSSGIGMIMGRYRIVKALGGVVVIVGALETVGRIINMSGLGEVVKLAPTMEEGLEEVSEYAKQYEN